MFGVVRRESERRPETAERRPRTSDFVPADEGRTLQVVANDLLKHSLHSRAHQPFSLQIEGWAADLQPGVDILDRDALFDVLNSR